MRFSTYCQNTQTMKLKPNQALFDSIYIVKCDIFYKKLKYFNDFQNMKFLSFITKLNPKNGSETKPDIYSKDIFKSDTIFFLSKKIKVFQWLQKSKFFNFLTKLKAKNENEAKSDIFP